LPGAFCVDRWAGIREERHRRWRDGSRRPLGTLALDAPVGRIKSLG